MNVMVGSNRGGDGGYRWLKKVMRLIRTNPSIWWHPLPLLLCGNKSFNVLEVWMSHIESIRKLIVYMDGWVPPPFDWMPLCFMESFFTSVIFHSIPQINRPYFPIYSSLSWITHYALSCWLVSAGTHLLSLLCRGIGVAMVMATSMGHK